MPELKTGRTISHRPARTRVTAQTATAGKAAPDQRASTSQEATPHANVTGLTESKRPVGTTHPRPIKLRLDAGHGDKPLNQHELRAHVMVDGKLAQVSFEHAFASSPAKAPGVYAPVTKEAIDAAWTDALATRKKHVELLLTNPDAIPSAPPVTPEDGAVQIAAYHMGFGAMDQAVERFIEQMADIGRVEGFRAVARLHGDTEEFLRDGLGREEENNTSFVHIDTYHDIWSEDAAEVHRDRSIGVPPKLPKDFAPSAEILKARIARYCPDVPVPKTEDTAKLYEVLKKHAPEGTYGVLGAVFERDAQLTFVGLALASKQRMRVNLCAVEGGNMLVGTDKDGTTHAFVGRDSFELSKRVLKEEVGGARAKKIDDALVMLALSKDLGVPVEQVHVVEQPADYHLDVKMIPIGPGAFLVNDSVAAAARQRTWALADHARKEPKPPRLPNAEANERFKIAHDDWVDSKAHIEERLKTVEDAAKKGADGEARAQRDLEAAGFKVHRVAAVYPWGAMTPMSFLNAEQGRGKDGERFYIALGGDKRGEKAFLDDMKKIGADVARFYFLDRELTFNTLQAGGGVNCRCKPEAVV